MKMAANANNNREMLWNPPVQSGDSNLDSKFFEKAFFENTEIQNFLKSYVNFCQHLMGFSEKNILNRFSMSTNELYFSTNKFLYIFPETGNFSYENMNFYFILPSVETYLIPSDILEKPTFSKKEIHINFIGNKNYIGNCFTKLDFFLIAETYFHIRKKNIFLFPLKKVKLQRCISYHIQENKKLMFIDGIKLRRVTDKDDFLSLLSSDVKVEYHPYMLNENEQYKNHAIIGYSDKENDWEKLTPINLSVVYSLFSNFISDNILHIPEPFDEITEVISLFSA